MIVIYTRVCVCSCVCMYMFTCMCVYLWVSVFGCIHVNNSEISNIIAINA